MNVFIFKTLRLLHPVVLSSDRVEQMTKTFNDIDVVTHLLAEVSENCEIVVWEKVLCSGCF